MPELPEVETIKIQLEKLLKGHKIESVEVKNRKIFSGNEKKLVGVKFSSVERFGKVISVNFSNGLSIVVHVKLTGQLIYGGPNLKRKEGLSKKVIGGVPGPHTHVIFTLDRGGELFYNDVRRFGWIKVIKTKELKTKNEFIKNLGPEPLKDLTLKKFGEILSSTKRNIKTVLMDQSKIAGVGNIYANDALFLSGISPRRTAVSLNQLETEKLHRAIQTVLKAGLRYGGASELAFVTPDGKEGKYQEHTLVYGRQGKPCKNNCGAKIKREFISGRGTYFCPVCQK